MPIQGSAAKTMWLSIQVLAAKWTSIHLVYVRISGKGITLHRLLRGDDDTSEIGIGNVLIKNNHG